MADIVYDPNTRITAGELRQTGLTIPSKIPDCAHIARNGMMIGIDPSADMDISERNVISCPMVIHITEPFVWVEATVIATKNENSDGV